MSKTASQDIQTRLNELKTLLKSETENDSQPQYRALCETAAEVVTGLSKAFTDCAEKSEPAWR
jgi:hypothetical protein